MYSLFLFDTNWAMVMNLGDWCLSFSLSLSLSHYLTWMDLLFFRTVLAQLDKSQSARSLSLYPLRLSAGAGGSSAPRAFDVSSRLACFVVSCPPACSSGLACIVVVDF